MSKQSLKNMGEKSPDSISQIKGVAIHRIMVDSEDLLRRRDHRGTCGREENTGDGAGTMTALPHRFRIAALIDVAFVLTSPLKPP